MSEPVVIDATAIEPKYRHPRIFETFDNLSVGESFLLLNDHDPKPLFYQFQMERPGEANWEPQEEGPERWLIRISKIAKES